MCCLEESLIKLEKDITNRADRKNKILSMFFELEEDLGSPRAQTEDQG